MKKINYRLQITKPCAENWNNMPSSEKGRFCERCAKQVVDFTRLSDAEIVNLLDNRKGKICGRMNENQLDRVIQRPRYTERPTLSRILAGIALLTTASPAIAAKAKAHVEFSIPVINTPVAALSYTQNPNDTVITVVSGTVRDALTNEEIPFASIHLKGSHKGVNSDKDGVFKLSLNSSDFVKGYAILNILYVGYDPLEVKIKQGKLLAMQDFMLAGSEPLTGDIVIVEEPVGKKSKKKRK